MNLNDFLCPENEKPLDRIVEGGGFCKIFRTIGCIGDSLSSGEFQGKDESGLPTYHDMYEYSWGQFMACEAGINVTNFSRGGMTAKEYIERYADTHDYWNEKLACQAYILALGVNDIINDGQELGSADNVKPECYCSAGKNFAGYYSWIIQRLRAIQPDAKFFLMTMPRENDDADEKRRQHAELLQGIAKKFRNTYVIDLFKYAPVYDESFKKRFFVKSHMNPAGYVLTAKMVMSYIDWYIRKYPEEFSQVSFIGKPYHC